MTRTHCACYTISLAVHLLLAAALLAVPIDRIVPHKNIALDFSIVGGSARYTGSTGENPGKKIPGEAERGGRDRAPAVEKKAVQAAGHDDRRNSLPVIGDTVPDGKKGIARSDAQGQVSITGERRAMGSPGSLVSEGNPGGQGGKGAKVLNYSGPGGVDERHFYFIRDRIMQNIVYPERARRMGWEGKVTISFVVEENGSIDNIRIVNSSGFTVLDENAKEAVARTNFKRKVPVRLVVLLPVEYRLR